MPASNSNPTKNKKHWIWGILSILVGILILIGLAYWIVGGGNVTSEQKKMESYLEKKYGKEFVVKNYRIEGSGLGVEGDPVADAYPKDDNSLKFKVRDRGVDIFADTYAQLYWSKQGEMLLSKTMTRQISDTKSISFSVTGGLNQNFFTIKDYPFIGTIPDVQDVLKKYSDRLMTSFAVQGIDTAPAQEPSDMQLKKAYDVMIFANNFGISTGSVGYTYSDFDYTKKNSKGDKTPRYSIVMEASKLSALHEPEQLRKYFNDREGEY